MVQAAAKAAEARGNTDKDGTQTGKAGAKGRWGADRVQSAKNKEDAERARLKRAAKKAAKLVSAKEAQKEEDE